MQKHSSRPFKMKYPEPVKGDTSIGFMWFSMSSMEPARTKRHASTETRPEPSNTGFTGSSPAALLDYGKVIAQDAPLGFLPRTRKDCETRYGVLPGSLGTTKTCGMVCCCLTTWRSTTEPPSVCANVKGCSISLDLPCKGPVAKLVRPILFSRRRLKKLLPVDERSRYSALV